MPEEVGTGYQDAVSAYQNHTNNAAIENNWLGGMFGTDSQYSSREALLANQVQNEYSSAEAVKSRNWQEYMSNTANQRAVKDLEAAGFSPLALLGNTSSASSPGGAQAHAGGSYGGHASKSGEMVGNMFKSLLALGVTSATVAAKKNMAMLAKSGVKEAVQAEVEGKKEEDITEEEFEEALKNRKRN